MKFSQSWNQLDIEPGLLNPKRDGPYCIKWGRFPASHRFDSTPRMVQIKEDEKGGRQHKGHKARIALLSLGYLISIRDNLIDIPELSECCATTAKMIFGSASAMILLGTSEVSTTSTQLGSLDPQYSMPWDLFLCCSATDTKSDHSEALPPFLSLQTLLPSCHRRRGLLFSVMPHTLGLISRGRCLLICFCGGAVSSAQCPHVPLSTMLLYSLRCKALFLGSHGINSLWALAVLTSSAAGQSGRNSRYHL